VSDASQIFQVTIPPGNGSTVSAYTPISIGLADVDNCTITWPSGCVGLVGVALLAAKSWAFPVIQNTYMAYDDYVHQIAVTNQIQTGNWGIQAYNADYFAHTITVLMEYDYVTTDVSPSPSLQVSV
jgi:hypothetical protein